MLQVVRKFLGRFFRRSEADTALARFDANRQQLQDEFFRMASSSGKPRGLRWTKGDWQPTFALVKDNAGGMLTAYIGVHVGFEAIEGGDMEDVEAVSAIREGSAVFHYHDGNWGTGGRLLFNMPPHKAVQRVGGHCEVLRVFPVPDQANHST